MTLTLDDIHLAYGNHTDRNAGMCAMEAAAYLAGEPHSDHPNCVCPVIAAFMRSWNDSLRTDADRDRLLKPLLPLVLNTRAAPAVQDARAFMAADWAVRVFTPAWLRLAGLEENAAELEGLKELATIALCQEARPAIDRATKKAHAAWVAAGDAAWDAAGDAAGAAVRAAAWDAAWDAAGAAARDAVRDAARDAARDAVRAAARAAAGDAARAALTPTVEQLQQSAIDLIHRMCALTEVPA